jgi:hypothetical protein
MDGEKQSREIGAMDEVNVGGYRGQEESEQSKQAGENERQKKKRSRQVKQPTS